MKKALFTFVFALLAATGAWAVLVTVDNLKYDLAYDSKTAIFKGCETEPVVLEIPATVSYESVDYTVAGVDLNALRNCSTLTQVTLPNTVTSIGAFAFQDCKWLKKADLGDGVTIIKSALPSAKYK